MPVLVWQILLPLSLLGVLFCGYNAGRTPNIFFFWLNFIRSLWTSFIPKVISNLLEKSLNTLVLCFQVQKIILGASVEGRKLKELGRSFGRGTNSTVQKSGYSHKENKENSNHNGKSTNHRDLHITRPTQGALKTFQEALHLQLLSLRVSNCCQDICKQGQARCSLKHAIHNVFFSPLRDVKCTGSLY